MLLTNDNKREKYNLQTRDLAYAGYEYFERDVYKMNPFVVLEGLSASGKTTIGKLLAIRLGAVFYKTPATLFSSFRSDVDQEAVPGARFFFYMAGLVQASEEIVLICENRPVVCDRYVDTTMCYHQAIGFPVGIVGDLSSVIKIPDLKFLVTCSPDKRIERLEKRGLSYNDVVEQQPGVEDRLLSEYKKCNLTEIDNSSDDPMDAVELMMSVVSNALVAG